MAFVSAMPLRMSRFSSAASLSTSTPPARSHASSPPVAMSSPSPKPPANFTKPDPRPFYIRPDKAVDMLTLSMGGALRLGTGATVEGYRIKREAGKFVEYSNTLPITRPDKPLYLFEFESCPFCRKVREVVSMLDIDVIFFPCPKGGVVYREYVKAAGGKAQFPYLEDPNTDFRGYESDDIIRYLYTTYGPGDSRVPLTMGSVGTISAALASVVRSGKGRKRAALCVPARYPVVLWGYELSPFVKLVRERLNELELAHLYRTAARGSATRKLMREEVGRFQVPYIEDANTGVAMFESAEICEYLSATYGAAASGAVAAPGQGDVFMPGDPLAPGAEVVVESLAREPSLDPEQEPDQALEDYCKDNPDADECKVFDE